VQRAGRTLSREVLDKTEASHTALASARAKMRDGVELPFDSGQFMFYQEW